ncbi:PHA/PHB synthase family protein [Aliirhizobium smilacinae]|uniref:PHA/PHB synthase family protein n=1 Tax=Aliirhizobium smilacinae TaxID=1395944 RepID=UPI001FE6A98D|nr:class I poly(R)-hydroxyalkanoic acid synthase [Rhizobium smilacinae]
MAQKSDDHGHSGRDFPGFDASLFEAYAIKDPQSLMMNAARAMENLGRAASEWLGPRERGETSDDLFAGPISDFVKTMSALTEYWMSDQKRMLEAQTLLLSTYFDIWMRSVQQAGGPEEKSSEAEMAANKDRRFADEDWFRNPFFSFLRQVYQASASWADRLVAEAEGLDEMTKYKARFYVKQFTAAFSPSNFAMTNPEVYRETIESHGMNLVAGMRMLTEDVMAGGGHLRLRQTDAAQFAVGSNLALTPGKVIARNELCEIIQYAPSTKTVFKRPLVIVPPWINKFYILDLTPEKSFIKWCVDQGHTVFVISWVNPDSAHAAKDWESYIREGIDFALDTAEQATGEKQVNAIGYCVGGTLLAAALAWHAQTKDARIASATLLTAQVDFVEAGELKVFVDEEQLAVIEKQMGVSGYLAASQMAAAFNLLRSSELIWPYVVNNYLKGKAPMPFDLLYWNSDSTRVAAANHAYYLRNCYLDNALSAGQMKLGGGAIDLRDIKIPVYNLATREDHIAPARSVFRGNALFGGPVEFVLSGSGHIAGVVNPPSRKKYRYWAKGQTAGTAATNLDGWLENAEETAGSWWPHWQAWIEARDPERVPARLPGDGALSPLGDAPGTYVLARA